MDPTIAVAVVMAMSSVAAGLIAARTAERARRTQVNLDANSQAIGAWRELVDPIREELERERAHRRSDEAEHVAELAAISKQLDAARRELARLRKGRE